MNSEVFSFDRVSFKPIRQAFHSRAEMLRLWSVIGGVAILALLACNTAYGSSDAVDKEGDVFVVEMTGNDQMKYNITSFEVPAGSTVRIEMQNIGALPAQAMSHNFVLLKPDTDEMKFALEAAQARSNDFIPESMEKSIIARTQMLGPGETENVEFKAPSPGSYTYLCSFPAHYQSGMAGTMTVTGK